MARNLAAERAGANAAGRAAHTSGGGNYSNNNSDRSANDRGDGRGQTVVNNVPVTDLSTQADPAQLAQQSALSRAVAAIRGQDFTPQLPNTAGGWMSMATNPFSPFTKSFMDRTRYGMSPASQSIFDGLDPTQRSNIGTPQDQVNYARNLVQQQQAAPNSYTGPQKPSNFSDQQWNSMTQGQQQFMSPEGAFGGQAGMSGQGGQGQAGGMMSQTNMGGSRDYSGAEGTFKPVTFRSGAMGQGDPYAGLSDMAQQGQGLFGQAAVQAQQAPDQFNYNFNPEQAQGLLDQAGAQAQQAPSQFNYNFNPEQAGQDLFNQRASLLQPQFAQQNAQAQESMFGTGRLGLRLAGEGIGAGAGSGMMSPDAFGVNAAQSQALAGLAAQSTNDAFGQELQRAGLDSNQFAMNQAGQQQQFGNLMGAGQGMFGNQMAQSGLDLSQFNANQMTQQQQYANLMGTGQGMLSGSMMEPEIRNQLIAQQQQQQALDQNYELGLYGNETARITGQAQANKANYQPDPWLSGLTSLGTSFLGSTGGSGWLSDGFSKGGWFS